MPADNSTAQADKAKTRLSFVMIASPRVRS
jgi:hypothetical protein